MSGADDVIRAIGDAFSGRALPAAAALVNDHCEECIETYRGFWSHPHTFVTWQEAARRPGSRIEAALLSVEAWQYYLPALMIWCVRDTDQVDALVDSLVHELTPPAPSNTEWFGPRSVGFTSDQRNAIAQFLEWYRERENAEWASLGREPPDDAADAIRYWTGAG
jgi:hypothetical protein